MNSKLLLLLPIIAIAIFSAFTLTGFNEQPSEQVSVLAVTGLVLDSAGNSERTGVKDNVEIIVTNPQGEVTFRELTHNKVVTLGENCAAKMLFGYAGGDETGTLVCIGIINNGFNYIALGESSVAVADADTTLTDVADSAGLATRLQGTIAWTNSTTGSFSTVVISATFTNTGASETMREVGLFNAATSGLMYAHTVISDAIVANGDDITINWTLETGEATVP